MSNLLAIQQSLAQRALPEELERQAHHFKGLALLRQILDAIPALVLVLNEHRQVVFVNRPLMGSFGVEEGKVPLGYRPGELLNCVNAAKGADGCGTSEFCQTCGGVNVILSSFLGNRAVNECRVTQRVQGELQSLDLRVWASPLIIQSEMFTIFSMMDIGDEKRRKALGRVISNMTKNALDAALPGQTVTIGCWAVAEGIQFWVHNPAFVARNVQLQLFQRSFSTKGTGRGLGTYSMRLLSERLLQGRVSFVSTEQEGTTFMATYPLQLEGVKVGVDWE